MNKNGSNSAARSRRASLVVGVPGLLAFCGLFGPLAGCQRAEERPSTVTPVYVSTVRNDAGGDERRLSGVVRPRIESDLAFRAGGKVTKRLVDLGQAVRQGQPLARIDDADYRLAVDAAAEQLRAAEVESVQSASDAARFGRLAADGSIGTADLERQKARADGAAARLAQARRQLDLSQNRAGYAVLTAPFDGVVTGLRFETGQVVPEGQPVITVARLDELEVVADVPEALSAGLREYSATATLGSPSAPGTPSVAPVALKLREMAPTAASQTRTFRARYAFAGAPPRGLQMGTTAEVRLARGGGAASAVLPLGALIATNGAASVWLADARSGTLTRTPVQVLAHATDSVRVAGLPDGALVVSVGAQKLDGGMKVQPVPRPLEAVARAEGRR